MPGGASGGVPNSLNLGEWYNYLVSTVTVDGEQNGNTNSTNPATDGNTEKVPASNVETAEATTKGAKVENKTAWLLNLCIVLGMLDFLDTLMNKTNGKVS